MGLRGKRKVLVICKGNVCRSAFAAAWMRANGPALGSGDLQIRSAGTEDHHIGECAHPIAILLAKEFDIDLRDHVAYQVKVDDLSWSDGIVAMDNENILRLRELFPTESAGRPLQLLGAGLEGDPEILDPDRKPVASFRDCFERIIAASEIFLRNHRAMLEKSDERFET